jgi:dihydroorotate dehydrogenase
MGFPNGGAEAAARRLGRRRLADGAVGVNVGKTKAVALEDAAADYEASVRRLAPLADYVVLNVSSPNTPGLRELQTVEQLRALVAAARAGMEAASARPPLLVKISPDLGDEDLDAVADLALELRLDGIVAVNTTVDRAGVEGAPAAGGVSGRPLKPRALAVLRRLHARTEGRLTLISVGGIETAEDAWERIRAGATLVQAYTGFVYGGPLWPRRVNRGLARLVREAGLASVQDAVASGAATAPVA